MKLLALRAYFVFMLLCSGVLLAGYVRLLRWAIADFGGVKLVPLSMWLASLPAVIGMVGSTVLLIMSFRRERRGFPVEPKSDEDSY